MPCTGASTLTRRGVCLGLVGLASAATTLRSEGLPALKALGAAKGITVGTSYTGGGSAGDRELITRHMDLIVPEWTLKPLYLQPTEHGAGNFAKADAIIDFGARNGLGVHGHTLYWYADRFAWADNPVFRVAVEKYGRFVAKVIGRYPAIASWDVFNEIVADEGPDILRPDYLMRTHGIDFVEALYKRVHELAPRAVLVLNDNSFQCGQQMCRQRQRRALRLVDMLLARNVPLHAFGIQSHLSSRTGLGLPALLEFIDGLAQRGLKIFLSELDVNDVDFADDPLDRDRQVADMYHDYLTAVLGHRAVRRMVFWGLSDRDHWLVRVQAHPGRPVGQGRPAPFDANLAPKPAFYAIADALATAPQRG